MAKLGCKPIELVEMFRTAVLVRKWSEGVGWVAVGAWRKYEDVRNAIGLVDHARRVSRAALGPGGLNERQTGSSSFLRRELEGESKHWRQMHQGT